MDDTRRALLWHGMFLILVGLLTGLLIPVLRNPRLGLSAHVGGVSNGMILLLFGFLWRELRLSPRLATVCFGSALYALYAIWGFTLLGAAFGTSLASPIAGAGFAASAWQEALVTAGVVTGGAASLVAVGIALHGLRGRESGG